MRLRPCRTFPAAASVALALGLSATIPADAWRAPCPPCREPSDDGVPFQWDDGAAALPSAAPDPRGFSVTVPVTPGASSPQQGGALVRYAEVAPALARCWSSSLALVDAAWDDLTLRVNFRRDGAISGEPRVVHVSGAADAGAAERARRSLLFAIWRCTPLALSLSLGQAIAGQIFAIRFTQQRTS